ncbi:MAG: saccharopine dehydrogenase NADP-binding domain-containing protein [Tissierellia bacterium]|nr:saccharopine dehydrogenase NADP-binding domain-containing protein [Tissierellia bacterium]
MNYLNKKHREYGDIAVGIIGSGLMGTSLLTQLKQLEGFSPIIMASRRRESLEEACKNADILPSQYIFSNDLTVIKEALGKKDYILTTDILIPATLPDVVVDCTGDTEAGARISLCAIENRVHIVTLNVEMDATIGPYLKYLADQKNMVYSGTAGDEPGAIMELYEFAKNCGFEIIALGKGKNNELNIHANPRSLREEAEKKGISPKMLTSFVDGTNTMIELTSVCNATGFVPDIRGCHNFKSTPQNLASDIALAEDGGVLSQKKVVDFVRGIAPGVFAIVKTSSSYIKKEMEYLKMGKGNQFAIYRPYHLTSIETPLSIIRAKVLKDSTIAPISIRPYGETITVAKTDLKRGQKLQPIGGFDVYGTLEKYEIAKEQAFLPIGLVVEGTVATRDIKAGELIRYEDVKLVEDSTIVKVRKLQNSLCED